MGGEIKYARGLALEVARDVLGWLRPLCARVVVAGSLRRRKAEVGDVEILYIARWLEWENPEDLFGGKVPTNVTDHALARQLRRGELVQRMKANGSPIGWGDSNKFAVHAGSGVPIDFFQATEATWWCNLVCRTGGAESNTALASAARERGWQWNPTGAGFTRIAGPQAGTVKAMRSEQEIFEFAGLPYLRPEERS